MIGIVIIAHGALAEHLLDTMEFILGPQTGVAAISVHDKDDRAAKAREICATAEALDDGSGVILVVDLFGSSPSNLCMQTANAPNRRALFGANMPMLLKLATIRGEPLERAARLALDAGRKYIDSRGPDGENPHP